MRLLQIGSDRSIRGTLHGSSGASARQEAYARRIGRIDDISFTRRSDNVSASASDVRAVYPTNSASRLLYIADAFRIARALPRPDVVSAQDPFEAGLAGLLIARMKGAPLHVQVHTDFLAPEYARLSRLNRLRVALAGFVLKRAARVRVVSERIKRNVEARYRLRAPLSVLPIFVDVERFYWTIPDPALAERFAGFSHKVLVVSRLEPEKDVALAIRAFDGYAPETACLILVGDGSQREALEALADSLKARSRIFFEGAQDPARYYKLADLVLLASRYEGYGLVIAEALAAGVPVLSTDVGAARELGAIVAPPDELGEKLVECFKRGPRAGRLASYPYKNFEEYVRAYCDDIAACAQE